MSKKIRQERITPEDARRYLANNPNNRKVRPQVVRAYAQDMKARRWRVTGDPIRFNGNGALMDGQHRLLACIEANEPFDTWVGHGFTDEDMPVIDTGAGRSLADVLAWRGEKYGSLLGSAITFIWRYQNGSLRSRHIRPTRQQVLDWLDANGEIRRSAVVANSVRKRVRMPGTAVCAVHFLASKIDPADADAFFELLGAGANLPEGSPIFAMRRWAERMTSKRDRPDSIVYAALLIKSINAWREGREVWTLGWRPGGASAEPFPELVALP
jgi:hypothetical protein